MGIEDDVGDVVKLALPFLQDLRGQPASYSGEDEAIDPFQEFVEPIGLLAGDAGGIGRGVDIGFHADEGPGFVLHRLSPFGLPGF